MRRSERNRRKSSDSKQQAQGLQSALQPDPFVAKEIKHLKAPVKRGGPTKRDNKSNQDRVEEAETTAPTLVQFHERSQLKNTAAVAPHAQLTKAESKLKVKPSFRKGRTPKIESYPEPPAQPDIRSTEGKD